MTLSLWLIPAFITVIGIVAIAMAAQSLAVETRNLRAELVRVSAVRDDARTLRHQLRRPNRA